MQFGHMISVAAIHFEDEFCTRWDREKWVGIVMKCCQMVAVLAGYRKTLVGMG